MTTEELKAAAEVMRRAAEGEPVEYRNRHADRTWRQTTTLLWNWCDCVYRIAPPKPREWWGVAWANHKCVITDFPERRDAEAHIAAAANRSNDQFRLVHITEVLP